MADKSYASREQLIEQAGRNLAGALGELAEMAVTLERQSRAARRRLASDVRAAMAASKGSTEAELNEAIVKAANRYGPELGVSASPSDALIPIAKPVFGVTSGCVGRPGGGVTADFGSVTVSMCVAGSLKDGASPGAASTSASSTEGLR